MLDFGGVVEVAGVLENEGGEVLGVGELRGGVAGAEGGAGVEDVQSAAASCRGAVLAALVGGGGFRRWGVHVHGRAFLGVRDSRFDGGAASGSFLVWKFGHPPVLRERCWKVLRTKG